MAEPLMDDDDDDDDDDVVVEVERHKIILHITCDKIK